MASNRRLAKAKKSPRFDLSTDDDPNHIKAGSIEHSVFGHVRLFIRAGQVYRLNWSSTEHGQNFHTRYWDPKKFDGILKSLGL